MILIKLVYVVYRLITCILGTLLTNTCILWQLHHLESNFTFQDILRVVYIIFFLRDLDNHILIGCLSIRDVPSLPMIDFDPQHHIIYFSSVC